MPIGQALRPGILPALRAATLRVGCARRPAVLALPFYNKIGITKGNPFATIDQTGVGKLMQIAIEGGRKTRPGISSASAASTAATRRRSASATTSG